MDERSGVVRTRGTEPFQLDMEYVLYVKAEDQNGRDGRRYQVEYGAMSRENPSFLSGANILIMQICFGCRVLFSKSSLSHNPSQ